MLASWCGLVWYGKVGFCRVCTVKQLWSLQEGSLAPGFQTFQRVAVMWETLTGTMQRWLKAGWISLKGALEHSQLHGRGTWASTRGLEGSHARFNVLLSLSGNS